MIRNPDLLSVIEMVKKASGKKEALQMAYEIVTKKYRGYRFRTYVFFWRLLELDPDLIWKRSGFLHCTQQNLILKTILLESGWFKKSEIKLGHSLVWYVSPHQYLKVKLNNDWLAVDPWNSWFGAKLGEYASGFGMKQLDHRS